MPERVKAMRSPVQDEQLAPGAAAGGQGSVVTRFLKLPAERLPDLGVGLR